MGASGVVFRQVPSPTGATHSFTAPPCLSSSFAAGKRFSGEKVRINLGCSRCLWPRTAFGFADNGHLEYHRVLPRCGGKEMETSLGAMTAKKKLKLLKGLLSDEFSLFSEFGSGSGGVGLVGEVQEKMVSEAADVLIKQLQEVRIKQKEMKKNKKLEIAKMKTRRMKDDESSSTSSSSDNEAEDDGVMSMSQLRSKPFLEQPPTVNNMEEKIGVEDHKTYVSRGSSSCSSSNISLVNNKNSSVTKATNTKRIEVCMGKKCKKSGGAALLNEFEKVIGVEGAVVGSKCMGKCRDGPNVRVVNAVDTTQAGMVGDDVSLCTGVGLQEVALIVANFINQNQN